MGSNVSRPRAEKTAVTLTTSAGLRSLSWGALGVALGAVSALHVVQADRSLMHQPVSFYIHGRGGWLLPLALGSFGAAAWMISRGVSVQCGRSHANALRAFGAAMVITAAVPCDPYFPWEAPASLSGIVHATVAVLAPPLLILPMWALSRAATGARIRAASSLFGSAYVVSMLASAASLLVGLVQDGPPPYIGMSERVLALSAVAWFALAAYAFEFSAQQSYRI
jgi:hypothetical protein